MKLVEILSPQMVMSELEATDKEGAIRQMCAHIAEHKRGLKVEDMVRTLLEREKLGSTGIGEGVAIPHGKLNGIDNLVACFAKSTPGIDFAAIDSQPSHLFFVLLAPNNSAGLHLKALARISRLLKSQEFRDRLLRADDATSIFRIISEEDARC
jgi:PTS system nitrogen regulatory IIA component